jgi:hypothetical protein
MGIDRALEIKAFLMCFYVDSGDNTCTAVNSTEGLTTVLTPKLNDKFISSVIDKDS